MNYDNLAKQEKNQLLTSFRTSLDAIVQKASQDRKAIEEEEPQLEKFCSTLEGILQFGFKNENKDKNISLLEAVWIFISKTLSKSSMVNGKENNDFDKCDLIEVVDYISKSNPGSFVSSVKIWIQICLVNRVLSTQWQLLMKCTEDIKENYHEWSILRTLDDSILISGFLNVFDTIEFNINSLPSEINFNKKSLNDIVEKSVLNFRSTINNTIQKTSQQFQKLQLSVNEKNILYYKSRISKNEKEISYLLEERERMQGEIVALHQTLEAERRLRQQLEKELELLKKSPSKSKEIENKINKNEETNSN